jgi:capsid assembly protease
MKLAAAFYAAPWAIQEAKLREIEGVIRSRFFVQRGAGRPRRIKSGVNADINEPEKQRPMVTGAVWRDGYQLAGATAVLGLYGSIFQRANVITDFSGGTSTQEFTVSLRAALADPDVRSIVLDCDSPGGCVYGVPELGAELLKARGKKRVVAVVNSLCASAAYWIGSAASEMVMTPSGQVGSIGVITMHQDFSQAFSNAGITNTLIYSGQYKAEGSPYQELSDDAKAYLQGMCDFYYTQFINAVAANRNKTPDEVREQFGKGRVLQSGAAISIGMVDRVGTFDEVLAAERGAIGQMTSARAEADKRGTLTANQIRQMQADAEDF